jgi:hydrogenase expression/formation protein HypC
MCLAIPAKILEINDDVAKVDFGGTIKEINVSIVDANIGDYVVVHAGFAIEIIDEEDALNTLEMFQQILELEVD